MGDNLSKCLKYHHSQLQVSCTINKTAFVNYLIQKILIIAAVSVDLNMEDKLFKFLMIKCFWMLQKKQLAVKINIILLFCAHTFLPFLAELKTVGIKVSFVVMVDQQGMSTEMKPGSLLSFSKVVDCSVQTESMRD